MQIEHGKLPLGFDVALGRGTRQPVQSIEAADGNARPFQIATPNPVFAFRDASAGGPSEERKGLRPLTLSGKPQSVSQRCRGRQRLNQAVEETRSIFTPAARRAFAGLPHGSRIASDATGRIRPSRYVRTVRLPIMISAVTGMPGTMRKSVGTPCNCTSSIVMRER